MIEITTTSQHSHSQRVPDVCTKALLHPPDNYRRSIIFEVGLTQTLVSLRERARMWLYQTEEEVHLVVLIKLLEVPPTKYVTTAGEAISRSRARKNKFAWPTSELLFEGRTLEQEIQIRSTSTDRELTMHQILFNIKTTIKEYLLQEESKGTLIPPLVEPIDATIYVYRRKDGNRDVSPALNPLKGAEPADETAWNQQGVVHEELAHRGDTGQEKDVADQDWGEEADAELESGQEAEATPKDGDEIGLDLVWSVQFMQNGSLTPNLPPDSQQLTFTIAELYGPLPIPTCGTQLELSTSIIPPALLQTMPPPLHAHALKKITFPLAIFAERIQAHRLELLRCRASARANKIVDVAYTQWYDSVQAEEERAQAQKRKTTDMELQAGEEEKGGGGSARARGVELYQCS